MRRFLSTVVRRPWLETAPLDVLAQATRFRQSAGTSQAAALPILIAAGAVAAAATMFLDFRLRVPGHAIFRVMLPMTLGMALAPRRLAGATMGLSALVSVSALRLLTGGVPGSGALTSLLVTGPTLDVLLSRTHQRRYLPLVFAGAGLASNMAAFAVRALAKAGGFDHLFTRPLATWWSQASASYAACGILAGCVACLLCFSPSGDAPRRRPERDPGEARR